MTQHNPSYTQIDLGAVERLYDDPRSVVVNKELGRYKMCQPREAEPIIDCYDVRRITFDLIQRVRELEVKLAAAAESNWWHRAERDKLDRAPVGDTDLKQPK